MELESGRIDRFQLITLMIGFFLSTLLVLLPGMSVNKDAWFVIILGLGEGMVLIIPSLFLAHRFRKQNLFQIYETVYGKIIGKMVSLLFLGFFLQNGSFVIRTFSDFFNTTVMPATPPDVFAILILSVSAYAIKTGLEPFARSSQILVLLTLGFTIFITLLCVNEIKLNNFQPFLEAPLPKLLWAAHGLATLPFAQLIFFLMILPHVRDNQNLFKLSFITIATVGLLILMVVVRTIGILGPTTAIFTYPGYQAVRMINISHILTRMEILSAIDFLFMGFIKITVCYYCSALGTAQLFGLSSYRPVILPLGVLFVILAKIDFTSATENFIFASYVYPIYSLPFVFLIPSLTLMIALIRKLPREVYRT